ASESRASGPRRRRHRHLALSSLSSTLPPSTTLFRSNLQGALVAVRASESAVAEARARLGARQAAAAAMRADVAGAQSAQRQASRDRKRTRPKSLKRGSRMAASARQKNVRATPDTTER